MRPWFFLVLVIFLLSCTAAPEQSPIKISAPEKPVEKEPVKTAEPVKVVEPPKPVIQPLIVSLKAGKVSSELKLSTMVRCTASGGVEPYRYTWKGAECNDESCPVILSKLSSYDVTCEVQDAKGSKEAKTITLLVDKEHRTVQAVIALGDSLTAGYGLKSPVSTAWPVLYAQSFKKAHVYNYAISGATTFSVKDYQLKFFWDDSKKFDLDSEYKLIFLWIGSNDVKKLFDPIVFQQNYEAIVDQLMSIPNKDLILMTIPDASKLPVAEGTASQVNQFLGNLGLKGKVDVGEISKEVIGTYNKAIWMTAKKYNLPVFDMYPFLESFKPEWITQDQFHPNEIGHELIKERIVQKMNETYPLVVFD